ncbi:hypothetical protein [Stappia sp. ES.058]|uniref:hypothetical protein n=1 Tax=Stappia sp. ES.058 TaxID=1881061 RepID=UPI0008792E32|nr:hypothetical protein [Stappia sp. ES.058]SDT88338.1 hypothetical protein SAMN05428979_0047 [Stappia sp. ES.058]
MATWTVKLKDGKTETVTDERLYDFRDMYVSDNNLKSRMSRLFLLDLYIMDFEFGISPHEILESVKELENGEQPKGVKPAAPFRNPPLKGLWHKHFFAARFLVHNMLLGLGKNGLSQIVESAMHPDKGDIVTKEMIDEVARRVTHEPLEQRNADNRLTGEWIVFLPHDGRNYYLSIAAHHFGDQLIFDRIIAETTRDFPDIGQWINHAATS